jgi:4-amino-4-deoxy-L-arabinose transferase-like glycosyltransferase
MVKIQQIGDKAAVGLSLLCVVHCLFLPILLILIPPLSGVFAFNDELFHTWLLYAVVPISALAMLMGYFHHRSQRVFLIGALGLIILILAAFLGHEVLGEYSEVAFTVLGSSIIAYSHIRNYQLRSQNKHLEPHN